MWPGEVLRIFLALKISHQSRCSWVEQGAGLGQPSHLMESPLLPFISRPHSELHLPSWSEYWGSPICVGLWGEGFQLSLWTLCGRRALKPKAGRPGLRKPVLSLPSASEFRSVRGKSGGCGWKTDIFHYRVVRPYANQNLPWASVDGVAYSKHIIEI